MLCKQHYEKMIAKLSRFEETLNPYLFTKITSVPATAFVADKQYHNIPTDLNFKEISSGWKWGGDWKGDKDYQHFYKELDGVKR